MPSMESPRASIFELQPLETRRFLTTASVTSGVLNINGSSISDSITVNKLSTGKVSVTGVTTQFTPGTGSGQFTRISILGNGGNDNIFVSGNVPYTAATLSGGTGDDTLIGGGKADLLRGDGGFDTANYSARTSGISVSLDNAANDGAPGEGDNAQTEEVIAGAGNDTLTGSGNADYLAGGGGNDVITANGGNDELIGANGADSLYGNNGDDALYAKNNDSDVVNGGTNSDGTVDLDLASVDSLLDKASQAGTSSLMAVRTAALSVMATSTATTTTYPSTLDTTFDGDGQALGQNGWSSVDASTVDAQGRTVVVGTRFGNVMAARFTADGAVDTLFGSGGQREVDYDNGFGYGSEDVVYAVTGDAQGNIYIAGSTLGAFRSDSDFAVAKLTSSGQVDTTFGNAGVTLVDVGNGYSDYATDVLLQNDGKIVLTGNASDGSFQNVAVARLTSAGALEATNQISFGLDQLATSAALQTLPGDNGAQRIVIAGSETDSKMLLRLNSDLSRDNAFFNGTGHVGDFHVWNDVIVTSNNEIYVVGASSGGVTMGLFGKFASDGTSLLSGAESRVDSFEGLALDGSGNLLAGGRLNNQSVIARYNGSDFTFDDTFDPTGPVVTDFTPAGSQNPYTGVSRDVFVLPDGKIISAGLAQSGSAFPAVARYVGTATTPNPDPTPDPTPTFEEQMQQAEVEEVISYDEIQNNPPPELLAHFENLTPAAVMYVKAQPDDQNRAVIDLTDAADKVTLKNVTNDQGVTQLAVDVNGVVVYYDLDTTLLTINGKGGNDSITTDADVDVPLQINGGAGNDVLSGGKRGDVLVGSTGTDILFGNAGNDLLIGGAGTDAQFGGYGEDILIGGTTSYDNDRDALAALSAEWASSGSNATRIANLRSGGGANGSDVLVKGTTVFDDAATDALSGDADRDWFFYRTSGGGNVRDKIVDSISGQELVTF